MTERILLHKNREWPEPSELGKPFAVITPSRCCDTDRRNRLRPRWVNG